MRIPTATYRIQFNSNFGFDSARKIVAYLAELGISDLYASPIFKARAGSTHGYDVVDPNQINPELGSEESFKELVNEIQQHNMGWLQDIVPNHMAYDSQNQLLMDVLENGYNSDYFDYFDIDWNHPYETIRERVLAPLLGNYYGDCLDNGEIKLQYDQTGLSINYYNLRLPVKIESYARFITYNLGKLTRALGRNHPDFIKFLGILYLLRDTDDESRGKERYDQIAFVKGLIWEAYNDNPEVKEFIDSNVEFFNGEIGKPESFNPLDNLISEQFYRLSFWKVGAEEINYRRFFTVNELISVKVEEIKVFHKTHELISQLVESGQVTGLRVDHIDGLYDPTEYLNRLREKVGDVYITVEKILEQKEDLPNFWPIQGTSGYEFLNYVNDLFCQTQNEQTFSAIYNRLTGFNTPYKQLFRDKKRLIIDKNLAGDVDNLAQLLKRVSGYSRAGSDFTQHGLQRALTEVLTYFPVYRTYINQHGLREEDLHYIKEVIAAAKEQVPLLLKELDYIEKILLLEGEDSLTTEQKEEQRHFVMKLQQLTGPLMAKGIEDTLLYVYFRLLSLNEVGGNPSQFGITMADFHEFNQKQQSLWPYKMNATATHDTKRGEDARARINVISEIPEEWEQQVKAWSELNAAKKHRSHGLAVPDRNDEYFFYQTLVGSFPYAESEYAEFVQRVKDYVIKAIREAKVHTAWLRPDTEYEEGCIAFVEAVLHHTENNQFLQELRSFHQRVADYGIFNSLSQTLLKMTSPGIPDFYQGSELWDLSFVDPDNRRPVNFEQRTSFLKDIKHKAQTDISSLMSELLSTRADGRIKLFLISRVLEARKQNLAIFEKGDYQPLEVVGKFKDHIVAFAKGDDQNIAITIAPRLLTSLVQPGEYPLTEKVWDDTQVKLSEGMPSEWQEAIAAQSLKSDGVISVGAALQHFPVALLFGQR
ncbi:MAG: malto-oligosyltrehalose synthase [Chroococcidiopsidaceae cyanobacterium CP_BM_ER_R8_30]|nr:malto-oligosyltrehalose synthase [Chroococcidiopsidaceae cyanobacterium CP_BM_ER_R8_30]